MGFAGRSAIPDGWVKPDPRTSRYVPKRYAGLRASDQLCVVLKGRWWCVFGPVVTHGRDYVRYDRRSDAIAHAESLL